MSQEDFKHLNILKELEISENRESVSTKGYFSTYENDPKQNINFSFNKDKILPIEDELLLEIEGSTPNAISIYKKLMSDQSVSSVFGKIVHEICSKEIEVLPYVAENEQKPTTEHKYIAAIIEKQIQTLNFNSLTKDLLEAIITGISTVELKWERTSLGASITSHKYIEPRRIQFNTNWEPYLLTKDNQTVGEPLKKNFRNFITFRYYQSPHDSPYGNGLGKILYHPVLFLRRAIESWLLCADRYATPLGIAEIPDEATPQERAAIMRQLSNLSREKAIVMPQGWSINFIAPTARADFYENQIAMYSKMINMLIAGESTTGEGGDVGSYGRDAISKSILMTRANYFSALLDECLNDTLIRYLVEINFGKNIPLPKFTRKMVKDSDIISIESVSALQGYGIPIDKQWMADTYKFKIDEKISQEGGSVGGINVAPESKETEVTGNVFEELGW